MFLEQLEFKLEKVRTERLKKYFISSINERLRFQDGGCKAVKCSLCVRGVARGGPGGGGRAPPGILQISKPCSNQGADYTPHTTVSPSGFKKLSTPLCV